MRLVQAFKMFATVGLVSLLAGCKLAVIVVQGGEVQSVSSGTCTAGNVCVHDITADDFSDTFTAVPDSGWTFVRWNSGGDFLCEDDTSPTCAVSNVGLASVAGVQAIIDSEKAYHIMPIFEFGGLPIPGFKADDNNQWAPPGLFAGLTYNEIAAACPGGVCSGILNGYNVDGWNWASGPMVAALFNSYFATACFYPCSTISVTPTDFFGDMLSDGFAITQMENPIYDYIDGYTSSPEPTSYAGLVRLQGADCSVVGCFAQAGLSNVDDSTGMTGAPEGAWLYR